MPTLQRLRPGTRFRLAEMAEITGVLLKANDCRAVVRLDCPERDVEFTDHAGQLRHFTSRGTHVTSWAPTTVVEPVGFETLENEENDMSKKSKTQKSTQPAETPTAETARKTENAAPAEAPPEGLDLATTLETAHAADPSASDTPPPEGLAPQTQPDAPEASKPEAGRKKKAKAERPADGKLSCLDAAAKVLADAKEPMTTKAMIEQMAAKKYWTSPGGKTPAATLYSALLREINTKGNESRFKKTDRGLFGVNG